MKELKMKDLVLEHYRKVYETEMDGVTVRVFKPRNMGKLPTYAMLSELKYRAEDASHYAAVERSRKVQWWLGNPDYGVWDAQLVRRFDPRSMTLDIYFASLLIRPFSRQAFDWYSDHSLVTDPVARLTLMWDSREFDSNGYYDTSYGAYGNQKDVDKYIYSGEEVSPYECMTDPKFDPILGVTEEDEEEGGDFINRKCVKLRAAENNQIEVHAIFAEDDDVLEPETNHAKGLFKDCAMVFDTFRKEHPEVTEIHFYTDELVRSED